MMSNFEERKRQNNIALARTLLKSCKQQYHMDVPAHPDWRETWWTQWVKEWEDWTEIFQKEGWDLTDIIDLCPTQQDEDEQDED